MPTAKKPAKAKTPARPQFGDWDQPRVTGLLVLADGTVIGEKERVSPYVALKAVTSYAAFQIKEEKAKGTLEPGKLADLVLWSPAFFGVKPDCIIKGGSIVAAPMGDPNASIPTPQPVHYQPMFAAYGKSLLQNPQINVFIKEFTSQRVTIEGAVSKPGIYPIKGKTSLLQAVALAEGIDMNLARLDSILVFRTVNSQRMAAKFDLNLIRSGDAADPQIFGDDIIVVGVSSRKWAYRKFLESIPLVNAFILY